MRLTERDSFRELSKGKIQYYQIIDYRIIITSIHTKRMWNCGYEAQPQIKANKKPPPRRVQVPKETLFCYHCRWVTTIQIKPAKKTAKRLIQTLSGKVANNFVNMTCITIFTKMHFLYVPRCFRLSCFYNRVGKRVIISHPNSTAKRTGKHRSACFPVLLPVFVFSSCLFSCSLACFRVPCLFS